MSNGKLKLEWTFETLNHLTNGIHAEDLDSFELWKAKRDEELRAERARKAAADAHAKRVHTLQDRTPKTYIVTGYECIENGSINHPPVPKVSLLYAGPDYDHALEIAVGRSRNQRGPQWPAPSMFDYTQISTCNAHGVPIDTRRY